MNHKTFAHIILIGSTLLAANSVLAMDTEHAQRCKNRVMTHTKEFESLPMAAISLSKGHHHNIAWNINWDGQVANGACIFHDGEFKSVEVHHHLKHHGQHKKNDKYKGKYGGFYYDRHIGQWRDPDGETCHSCTPENGFPRHGG